MAYRCKPPVLSPDFALSEWSLTSIEKLCGPKKGAFGHHFLARLEAARLAVGTSADVIMHLALGILKGLLVMPLIINGPAKEWVQGTLRNSGRHLCRALVTVPAVVAGPVACLISPEWAVSVFDWLKLRPQPITLLQRTVGLVLNNKVADGIRDTVAGTASFISRNRKHIVTGIVSVLAAKLLV